MNNLSTMFWAFCHAKVASLSLADRCVSSMERHMKHRKGKQDKGWKANLSYRTYRHLVSKGVPV